jgi:pilus assembly protein CpaE
MSKAQILFVGRSKKVLTELEAKLGNVEDLDVTTLSVVNGHMDPLYGVEDLPTILVLALSQHAEEELRSLAGRPASRRPPTLVVAEDDDPSLMRLAMKAGARDFFSEPVPEDELATVLRQILREERSREVEAGGRITALINAKGGSGATFLASNIAHILRVHAAQRVALVDLDFQFPSSGLTLDLSTNLSLIEALDAIDDLDALALDAYMMKHKSGLAVLSPPADQVVLPGEIKPEDLRRLLELVSHSYEQVVCDLPRQVDPATATVMELAHNILIVMQQSLAHVRDAKRLLNILKTDLQIGPERISVVINRYDAKSRFQLADLERALELESFWRVPNDFDVVDAATNLGVPIHDYARQAGITKSLIRLAESAGATEKIGKRGGFIARAISGLMRR